MKKKLLIALLSLTTACGCAAGLSACNMFGGKGKEEEQNDSEFLYEYTEDNSGLVITRYYGNGGEVTIPEQINGGTVKEIGNAFNGDSNVTKVVLPDTVTKIGIDAFANTSNLKEVVFSKNLEVIDNNAFYKSGLESVALPATVNVIQQQAFYENKNLTSFTLAAAAPVETIENHAFNGCSSLKTVELSDNIKSIGQLAFNKCTQLQSINLKHVENVMANAFDGCTSLAEANFGDSIDFLGSNAFSNTALSEVSLPDTCTAVGTAAFGDCANLKEVSIPAGAMMMGGVFRNSYNVETLTLPATYSFRYMFEIGTPADDYSTVLTKFTTLNVVGEDKIEDGFAANYSKLVNITIDERISEVSAGCFENTGWYNAQPDGLVYLNQVLLGYKGTAPSGTLTVKEGTLGIADSAFSECTQITQISLPAQLKNIGENAFDYCSITSLTLPEALEKIGDSAFDNCASLTTVNFNDKLTSLGEFAFQNCNITGEVVLPSTLEALGDSCLKGNSNITKLTITFNGDKTLTSLFGTAPQALTEVVVNGSSLPTGAFKRFGAIEKITLSEEITEIPSEAFYSCTSLSHLIYGNITKIGGSAFYGCNAIVNLVVPDSVTEIGDLAFANMSALESVTLGSNLKTLGARAFAQCRKLKTVVVNDGLETIGNHAFANCQLLTDINFGASLRKIENAAFEYCYALENVQLNSGLAYLGDEVFSETKLAQLIIPESVTYVGSRIVKSVKPANAASFKLLVESTAPVEDWNEAWNVNTAEEIDGEIIYNYYPTYYYSETDKTDDELLFWHYVEGEPELW